MNVPELIKQRLEELGHEQRELAAVAEVTESYISQSLTGKKSLPAPNRSDIYEKIEAFLKLSSGVLTKLAELQRKEELAFLKRLRFKDKRPTELYYYRELQNLRDPLHFQAKRST